MFVYKWTVDDVVKGTALVEEIGECVVKDKGKYESTYYWKQNVFLNNFKSRRLIRIVHMY